MVKKEKLAIVIPYYKLDYFRETLLSIRNQTNQNFNLYIGNDCSPNNPNILIEEFNDIITEYKLYNDNIGGINLNKHWNRSIDDLVRNEEWIMVLCDDDFLDETCVNEFYNHINEINDLGINVIRYATRIVNQNNSLILNEFNRNKKIEASIHLFEEKILETTRSSLSEYIFSVEAYKKNKFKSFECSFGSDNVAWLEFSDFKSIYCINNCFIYYRNSELSVSGNPTLKGKKMLGEIQYLKYLIKNYKNKFSKNTQFLLYERYYHYFRSLYNKRALIKTTILILKMIHNLGLDTTIKIIKNNKNYFKKLYT